MNRRTEHWSRKAVIPAIFFFLAVTAVYSYARLQQKKEPVKEIAGEPAVQAGSPESPGTLSKVLLSVEGMSCSGCVLNIESSLSKFDGIDEINVDVSAGKAEIYYDHQKLGDVNQVAAAITGAGYPARIDRVLSPEELKRERDLVAAQARLSIASVGGADISRAEFNKELAHAKSRYSAIYGGGVFSLPQGATLEDNLKAQVASRLVDEGIQLNEIERSGYKIDSEKLDQAYREFLGKNSTTSEEFKASLEETGYSMDQFKKRFERQVLIRSYLDDQIFGPLSSRIEKGQRYSEWFSNAQLLAKVVYYDKDLERLVRKRAASGCGGGGCSSGSRGKAGKS